MCQDEADENLFVTVIDFGDEPVFIAANVEYCANTNRVGVWKITSRLRQVIPVGALRDSIPGL
jgi:hypothetical protein